MSNPLSGLYLSEPHGEFLFQGKQTAIIKGREFKRLEEFNILLSKDKAYGMIIFNPPEKVNLESFKKRYEEHKISDEDRESWWPDRPELYLYAVKEFIKFDKPRLIKQITGAQVFVDDIEFLKEELVTEKIEHNLIDDIMNAPIVDLTLVSKPYPSEHAARVVDPGKFEPDSFRRKSSGDVSMIMGKLKGESTMTVQAYRFPKDKFTPEEAKAWCKEHDIKYISFEPAKEETKKIEKSWDVQLFKAEEERFAYGVVLQPIIEDLQGDIVDEIEISKTAHAFMENCQNIGLQHNTIVPQIKIWESYITPQELTFGKEKVLKGSWILGVHVLDDKIWEDIKSGGLTGFSIHGEGNRTKIS